jgi:CDP-diacylglycerol--glycerol-3-phosphate 3-phosphatidyltransferase
MLNVPNVLTTARLVLAVVVFVLVPLRQYLPAFVVFVLAASTDWVDGYWARRFNQVTQLGRIFDPFVDKIIVCGAFIFLAAEDGSGIVPWMAVVVVGRELMVTALRSFIEQGGGDFSATVSGKVKMVLQCVAIAASFAALAAPKETLPAWWRSMLDASVWLAVAATVYSGAGYVLAAARTLRC